MAEDNHPKDAPSSDVTFTEPLASEAVRAVPKTLVFEETPLDPLPLTVDVEAPVSRSTDDDRSFTFSDLSPERLPRPHPSPSDPLPRQTVPGFEILKELGRGGMGVVYQARQQALNRLVALKMILSGAHASLVERERFRREAEAVAQLRHPNIVQIHDIGEVDECPYLAFEYIDGGTLASHLTGDPWPGKQAASMVEMLARAMDYAHQQGIIHRDLKPGNILLQGDSRMGDGEWGMGNGEWGKDAKRQPMPRGLPSSPPFPIPHSPSPKITDFGLAKRVVTGQTPTGDPIAPLMGEKTRTGAVMGTPSYISPEQAAGKNREVGPAADIYALGAILYELLTGRPPFKGETPLDTVLQVMSDDPIAPSRLQPKIPRDLETICMKCLQKLPSRRYASAAELGDDLSRFQRGEPIRARPVGSWERLIKWAKRHPTTAWLSLFSGLVVVILLGGSVYYNIELQQANHWREQETEEARRQTRISLDQTRIAQDERNRTREALEQLEASSKELTRREEINRRGTYALQLSQASALAERDPRRAIVLLDQVRNDYRDFTWNYLRRLCNRELHVWKNEMPGPVQGISSVLFSPDGSLIASACWDSTVKLYDAVTNRPVAVFKGRGGLMLCVTFSHDGRTIAASSDDGQIHLWEVPTKKDHGANEPPLEINSFTVLKGHRGAVRAIAFSPKSHYLASGGEDGELRFWPVPPSPAVGAILLGSPFAIAARTDAEVKEVMCFTPVIRSLAPLEGHSKGVWAIECSRDGERLFTGSEDKTVRVWDLKAMPQDAPTSEILHTFRDPVISISSVQLNNQELLAVATNSNDDPSIRIWNVEDKREVHRLRGHTQSINRVCFNAEGNLLLSGGADKTVRLWDVQTGSEKLLLRGHEESVRSVAFSPTQPLVVSGDLQQQLHLWNIAPQREETREISLGATLDSAMLSRDGTRLAISEKNGVIRVWRGNPDGASIPALDEIQLKGHRSRVFQLAFSADGNTLASASVDGEVRIWDLRRKPVVNGQGIAELTEGRATYSSPGRPRALVLLENRLLVGGEKGVRSIDLPTGQQKEFAIEGQFLRAMAVSGDGQKLATTNGRFLQFWNLATFELECTKLVTALQSREIVHLAFEPLVLDPSRPVQTGWRLVTSYDNGKAHLWDVLPIEKPVEMEDRPPDKLLVTENHELIGHGERIESLAFAPNGKTLVTGSGDRTIKFWDPLTGADRGTLTGHTNGVILVAFLPNTRALLTVGREGVAKLWRVD